MRDKNMTLEDRISFKDNVPGSGHPGMWSRTEVIVGYGDVHDDGIHKAFMDDPVYTGENTVVIGGVQYTMQKLFNIPGAIDIPTLHSENGIGLDDNPDIHVGPGEVDEGIGFKTPLYTRDDSMIDFDKIEAPMYRTGHFVQLFGVGVTGSGETDTTVYPVDYREKSINMDKEIQQNVVAEGTMYPFRYTTEDLNNSEVVKYYGKQQLRIDDGTSTTIVGTAYYLKKFETVPKIKHIYASEDPDVETEIDSTDPFTSNKLSASVETFVEMKLKISNRDLKEYFIATDQANKARINTIALYSGRYVAPPDNDRTSGDYGDFEDVYMFSKIIIPPEYLNLNKDINIIYRVYGS